MTLVNAVVKTRSFGVLAAEFPEVGKEAVERVRAFWESHPEIESAIDRATETVPDAELGEAIKVHLEAQANEAIAAFRRALDITA